MSDPFFDLSRTGHPDTSMGRLTFQTHDFRSTFGASGRHGEYFFRTTSPGDDDFDNFRDHITGPLDNDSIADTDVLLEYFIQIVKGRPADHDAAQSHGLHQGDGCQNTGASHLDQDILYLCCFLHCRKFTGDSPAGIPGNGAQFVLKEQIIHLMTTPSIS